MARPSRKVVRPGSGADRIDQQVYALYDLAADEIRIVEEATGG